MPRGTIRQPVIAKQRCRTLSFAGLLLALVAMVPAEGRGEFIVAPALTAGEEYNDNIFLEPYNPQSDYITRLKPSVRVQYLAPFWDWDFTYIYDYQYYARLEDAETTTTARFTNQTRLITDILFLEVRDIYDRTSLSVIRDYTEESSFINQTDRNILAVNPYLLLKPGTDTTIKAGYTYQNLWYRDPEAVDKIDHIESIETKWEASPRLALNINLWHTSDANRVQDYRKSDAVLGPRYEYVDESFLWCFAGATMIALENSDVTRQLIWDAGITHKIGSMSLTVDSNVQFIDDPLLVLRRLERYAATLSGGADRTTWSLTAGVFDYRNVMTQRLQERTYRSRGTFSHAISEKWRGTYDLLVERFEYEPTDTLKVRYITTIRFEYQAAEKLVLSVNYRYTDSYSPDNYYDNYANNRFAAEATYSF